LTASDTGSSVIVVMKKEGKSLKDKKKTKRGDGAKKLGRKGNRRTKSDADVEKMIVSGIITKSMFRIVLLVYFSRWRYV
jgi:hypothetical protein